MSYKYTDLIEFLFFYQLTNRILTKLYNIILINLQIQN